MSRNFKGADNKDMLQLIKAIRRLKSKQGILRLEMLDLDTTYIEVYSDASFGNIENTYS